MPSVTLACPVCNFSKEMDAGAFPPPGTKVTCPVCKSVFPLQAGAAAGSGEAEAGLPPPRPRGAQAPARPSRPPARRSAP